VTSFLRKSLKRATADAERGWPNYMFGGHVRTSTLVLVIAFLAVWWVYDDHQQSTKSTNKTTQVPATQVVPPGFVPDPNYTWVPRTQVQETPTTVTVTPTPTASPTSTVRGSNTSDPEGSVIPNPRSSASSPSAASTPRPRPITDETSPVRAASASTEPNT